MDEMNEKETVLDEIQTEEVTDTETDTQQIEENTESADADEAAADAQGYDLDNFDSTEISDDLKALSEAISQQKKKKVLMTPIVVSLCIVICAAVAALTIGVFFNKSIEGSWYLSETYTPQTYANSTEDEPDAETMILDRYFVFEGNGKLLIKSGNETSVGSYTCHTGTEDDNAEGKPVVDIDVIDPLYNQLVSGSYIVDVEGNIFTGKKLMLTSVLDEASVLEMESKEHTKPELKRDGEFKSDDKIVGKWINTMDGFGVTYTIMYEFNADGTFLIENITSVPDSLGDGTTDYIIDFDGIYNCENGTVTLQYFVVTDQEQEISYQVDGDILTVKGVSELEFYKVGTPSGDEIMNQHQ